MNLFSHIRNLLCPVISPRILGEDFLSCLPHELAKILEAIQIADDGSKQLIWNDFRVCSAFQPIVSFTHNCIVGHEALARPYTRAGEAITPPHFFNMAYREGYLPNIDRACRLLHILNAGKYPGWLFLNFHPVLFSQQDNEDITASYVRAIVDHLGIDPTSIMVEVVENEVQGKQSFENKVQQLRLLGFNLAIDDFGTGESNFERLMSVQPDIVKLDRSFARQCVDNIKVRKVLPHLVELLHEIGSRVVLEGIETENQALIALDANIDFGQGWYFARPQDCPYSNPYALTTILDSLWKKNNLESVALAKQRKETLDPIFRAFEQMGRINDGDDGGFNDTAQSFLNIHAAKRIYLLNSDGFIATPPLIATCRATPEQPCLHCNGGCPQIATARFNPLPENQAYMKHARLSRHSFFQRALEQHGIPQLSRPYVSPCDGKIVSTISMSIILDEKIYVVCGDLNWESLMGKLEPALLMPYIKSGIN